MNDPKKNIRHEDTLEERYIHVSEQLATMSERFDALSSVLEKERLHRSEMVNEQVASELAALCKWHEEEVARIKAEARAEILNEVSKREAKTHAEILNELSQREAEVEKRSAALNQREKELDVRLEKANDLLIPKTIDDARREFKRAKTENVFLSNFGLASFQIIYGVEELIKELGLTGADKIAYRKENAAIAWQSLLAWCVITVSDVPQNSQMHKACNYVIQHYDELTAYMDYDVVPSPKLDKEQSSGNSLINYK